MNAWDRLLTSLHGTLATTASKILFWLTFRRLVTALDELFTAWRNGELPPPPRSTHRPHSGARRHRAPRAQANPRPDSVPRPQTPHAHGSQIAPPNPRARPPPSPNKAAAHPSAGPP